MRKWGVLAGLVGLSLFCALIAYTGLEDVAAAIAAAGWIAAIFVVGARAVALIGDGIAWRFLLPRDHSFPTWVAVFLRFVREGVNQLLPVAAVGGDFVGARLATFWRLDGATAGASVVADVGVQAATQFLFAMSGLVILMFLQGDGEIVRYAGVGLGAGAFGIGGFLLLQGPLGSRIVGGVVRRLGIGRNIDLAGVLERFWERLGRIYASPGRLAACVLLHQAVWFFGAYEVWIVFHFMGHPISFAEAIVIESLGQAIRGAAFAVPGGLGVQEGGYVALCALFGIPASAGLALSIVKRVADITLGIPGLMSWQILEGRRAFAAGMQEGGKA